MGCSLPDGSFAVFDINAMAKGDLSVCVMEIVNGVCLCKMLEKMSFPVKDGAYRSWSGDRPNVMTVVPGGVLIMTPGQRHSNGTSLYDIASNRCYSLDIGNGPEDLDDTDGAEGIRTRMTLITVPAKVLIYTDNSCTHAACAYVFPASMSVCACLLLSVCLSVKIRTHTL